MEPLINATMSVHQTSIKLVENHLTLVKVMQLLIFEIEIFSNCMNDFFCATETKISNLNLQEYLKKSLMKNALIKYENYLTRYDIFLHVVSIV